MMTEGGILEKFPPSKWFVKEKTMREFVITTDNNGDLPKEYTAENNIEIISLSYILEGQTYTAENSLPFNVFYDKVRNGAMPTTSQINPDQAEQVFQKLLEEGKDILHISFSSGLSGSCNSINIAISELEERYPDAKMVNIDSLTASMGQGLLVYHAVEMKKAGKSMEDIIETIEDMKPSIAGLFTVDDLNHLHRGGRVSKATAIIGSMANIKPILHVDKNGKLASIDKARGRKKSLNALVEKMEVQCKGMEELNEIMIMISHGDCLEDAIYLKDKITEKFGYQNFMISDVCPTIGAHSGPGTVALFFHASSR